MLFIVHIKGEKIKDKDEMEIINMGYFGQVVWHEIRYSYTDIYKSNSQKLGIRQPFNILTVYSCTSNISWLKNGKL